MCRASCKKFWRIASQCAGRHRRVSRGLRPLRNPASWSQDRRTWSRRHRAKRQPRPKWQFAYTGFAIQIVACGCPATGSSPSPLFMSFLLIPISDVFANSGVSSDSSVLMVRWASDEAKLGRESCHLGALAPQMLVIRSLDALLALNAVVAGQGKPRVNPTMGCFLRAWTRYLFDCLKSAQNGCDFGATPSQDRSHDRP